MEVKPSPTSPKAKKMKDIEKLYNDKSLQEIHKPSFRNGRVFIIILAIVIGIFSGFFGGYFFYNYFGDSGQSTGITSVQVGQRNNAQQTTDSAKIIDSLSSAIVGIFLENEEPTAVNDPRSSLYNPWDQLSTGLAVTSDGWIAIPRWATPDLSQSYVAVTSDNEVYKIEKIMADAVTPIYFVKIGAENLPVVEFVDREESILTQSIYLLTRNEGTLPMILPSSIIQQQHIVLSSEADYLESSDSYQRRTLVSNEVSEDYQGAVAVDLSGRVVGLVASADWPTSELVPAFQIRGGLTSLLKNGEVIRSSLGVHYIDLTTVANISTLYSQGKKQGALLYGDLEAGFPTVADNSAAAEAGLTKNDVILKVNGINIDRSNTLTDLVQDQTPGAKIKLEIVRDSETVIIESELNALK